MHKRCTSLDWSVKKDSHCTCSHCSHCFSVPRWPAAFEMHLDLGEFKSSMLESNISKRASSQSRHWLAPLFIQTFIKRVLMHLQFRRPQFDSWVGKMGWRRDRLPTPVFLGFPCGSAGKESTCNGGNLGSIPELGRFPGEGKGCPLQCSGLENFMDCIGPWGWKELDTAERLSLYEPRPGEQQIMKISKVSRNLCKTVISAKDLGKAGEEDGEMGVGGSNSIILGCLWNDILCWVWRSCHTEGLCSLKGSHCPSLENSVRSLGFFVLSHTRALTINNQVCLFNNGTYLFSICIKEAIQRFLFEYVKIDKIWPCITFFTYLPISHPHSHINMSLGHCPKFLKISKCGVPW